MEPKRYVYLQSHTLVQTVGELNPLSTIPLPPCDIDRKSSVPGHTATHQHCSKQPMALSHKQQEQQRQRRPQQQHSATTPTDNRARSWLKGRKQVIQRSTHARPGMHMQLRGRGVDAPRSVPLGASRPCPRTTPGHGTKDYLRCSTGDGANLGAEVPSKAPLKSPPVARDGLPPGGGG